MLKNLTPIFFLLMTWGCLPEGGVYHTVKEGETIARISDVYSVDEVYLARLNDVSNADDIRVGQKIFVPGVDQIKEIKKEREKTEKKTISPRHVEAPAKSEPLDNKNVLPNPGRFSWPVQGKITKDFGAGKAAAGKGIEIAVPYDTSVHSSASGQVIYSGNGINGFGNLIIIKHEDSFFTVYGYNSRNLVDKGDFVAKGEKIAMSGTPPAKEGPRLYFEIRHGKQVVNPFLHLP